MVSNADVSLDFNLASFFVSPIFEFFNTIGSNSGIRLCPRQWLPLGANLPSSFLPVSQDVNRCSTPVSYQRPSA